MNKLYNSDTQTDKTSGWKTKGVAVVAAKLLSFTVANNRSFLRPQTFDFTDGDGRSRTLTVICGPNASGKSNGGCALQDFHSCIINSSSANWRLPYVPFLLRKGATDKPTTLEVVFMFSGRRYAYAFSFVADRVTEESLRAASLKTGRMNVVFHRGDEGIDSKVARRHGFTKALEKRTRPDTLLVTKAHEDNNPFAAAVFNLVESTPVMLARGPGVAPQAVEMLRGNEDFRARILRLLKDCDFAIRDIAIGERRPSVNTLSTFALPRGVRRAIDVNAGATISTLHAVHDDELNIVGFSALDFQTQESCGTRAFLEVAVAILSALDKGHTLYVDEYGANLHPTLARALASLFKGGENGTGARLIVNTQNTALMGEVADCDDIVFVERDMAEESRVTSLKDRGARTTEPLENRYLRGLYGGVPRVRGR